MNSLDAHAMHKLDLIERDELTRSLQPVDARALNFCSNDYLGLSQDQRLKDAAAAALATHGAGAGASRLVTGNHALYGELEARLAQLKGTEAALVFGSGYLANVGAIPAIVGVGDLIIADELSHACMMTGARLSGADALIFRHNDIGHLRALLEADRSKMRHCLVLTEGVFSMDGDLAPLPDIIAAARDHNAWVMTDDAHGLGVVGGGCGSAAHWGVRPDIQMGTLSKSVGAYGGYVAASRAVVDLLINRARSLIYATGLPPAVVGAAIAGVDIIANDPARCGTPLAHAQAFAAEAGLTEPQSAIVPVVLGDARRALNASRLLAERGFAVTAIRPPTVPDGTARLRITFQATHKRDEVIRLARIVRDEILK